MYNVHRACMYLLSKCISLKYLHSFSFQHFTTYFYKNKEIKTRLINKLIIFYILLLYILYFDIIT